MLETEHEEVKRILKTLLGKPDIQIPKLESIESSNYDKPVSEAVEYRHKVIHSYSNPKLPTGRKAPARNI